MSIHLRNPAGQSFTLGGGHWSVYLTLAQAYGWKPAGTQPPPNLLENEDWNGCYDSSDGQVVSDADAKLLAQVLHAAAVSESIATALADVIARIEGEVAHLGIPIPDGMRMKPNDFSAEFSPLLLFLYQGTFTIE